MSLDAAARAQAPNYGPDIPYIGVFARETAPAWLDHVALLSGVAPPARDAGFSWCDLGCGQGVTAAILAATHPRGRFFGIDAMPAHIDHARRLAPECGIANLDLHAADFATAAASDLGGFDYIVAHGVYSWVDEEAQAALRGFIDRHLKPGGLVYLSYYAMPGRAADLPFQRLVRAIGRTLDGDRGSACAAAIEIVNAFTRLKAPALVASPMAVEINEHPEKYRPAYLAHEFMVEHWEPQCVTEVRAAMSTIGLEPVGSADLIENYDSLVLGKAAREALAAIEDDDARELARDFMIDQFFRRDVLVRDGRRIDEDERRRRLLASTFMLARPAATVVFSVATPAGELKYDNEAARGIVAGLAGGPMRLSDIAAKSAIDEQDALANALILCAADAVRPVEGDRAVVTSINRTIRRRLGGAHEILHLALPCGTALPIKDTLLRIFRGDENAKDGEAGQWLEYLSNLGV